MNYEQLLLSEIVALLVSRISACASSMFMYKESALSCRKRVRASVTAAHQLFTNVLMRNVLQVYHESRKQRFANDLLHMFSNNWGGADKVLGWIKAGLDEIKKSKSYKTLY